MLNIVYCLNLAVNFKMKQISKLLLFSKRITKCLFFFFSNDFYFACQIYFFFIFLMSAIFICPADLTLFTSFFFLLHAPATRQNLVFKTCISFYLLHLLWPQSWIFFISFSFSCHHNFKNFILIIFFSYTNLFHQ